MSYVENSPTKGKGCGGGGGAAGPRYHPVVADWFLIPKRLWTADLNGYLGNRTTDVPSREYNNPIFIKKTTSHEVDFLKTKY